MNSQNHQNKDENLDSVAYLQSLVKDFCDARDWGQFHDPKELAIGLSTEAGELLQLFRFKSATQAKDMIENPAKRERVEEELADSLYFILRFAQMNQIDLGAALKSKIIKNEEKYPLGLSRGSNKKYNEF